MPASRRLGSRIHDPRRLILEAGLSHGRLGIDSVIRAAPRGRLPCFVEIHANSGAYDAWHRDASSSHARRTLA